MAAAPVVAGVGVASVATISAGVAAISATAAVVTKKAESTLKKKANEKHIVYGLKDSSENIQYVGRTKQITARKNAHQANPARKELKMIILADNLSYEEARGIEQVYMLYYHTINTKNAMNNQINGISPYNKKLGSYLETAKGALGYLWNQVSNEVLC